MSKKITIALDCMGGDNAPDIILAGANAVAAENSNVFFNLYGNQATLNALIALYPSLQKASQILHAEQVINGDDKPSVALRKGTKSSMRLAIDSVKDGLSDTAISAGNTGALMAMSKVILRPLAGIDRPAIVTFMPNQKKSATVMLDMGANVDCSGEVLYQFAIMGYAFAKAVLKIDNPTIGVLNVGSEDLKGSEAVKTVAALLKESQLASAFYGYVEGDDLAKGTVDVVVTDGFCGNITLKAIEGTAKMVSSFLKEGLSGSIFAKIGYLFARNSLKKTFKKIDPRLYNGAMLVGLNGIVVKSHGSADQIGFANAIKVAISLVENQINQKIIEQISNSAVLKTKNDAEIQEGQPSSEIAV